MMVSSAYNIQSPDLFGETKPIHVQESNEQGQTLRWDGPEEVGNLTFTKYQLPGVSVTEFKGELNRPLAMEVMECQPATALVFQVVGSLKSLLENQRNFLVESGQNNLVFEPNGPLKHFFYPDLKGDFLSICCRFDPAFYTNLIQENSSWLPLYEPLLQNHNPWTLFNEAQPTSHLALELLSQIRSCPYSGTLRKLYLEARLLDLFLTQQQHYVALHNATIRRHEQELAYGIREHLDQHYTEAHSLRELARQFGTNDCTLKRIFRQQFNTTVFTYIAHKRLSEAYVLLSHTQQNVREIAEAVGFSNPAHFATAFKRQFGLSPLQARRNGVGVISSN